LFLNDVKVSTYKAKCFIGLRAFVKSRWIVLMTWVDDHGGCI